MGADASSNRDVHVWTVRDLRRRWKPAKERLSKAGEAEGLRIRLHRCCSWLQRVEQLPPAASDPPSGSDGFDDAALVCRWIALNALYARWDEQGRAPFADVASLDSFTSHITRIDHDGRIVAVLRDHKRLVLALLEDEFLSRNFWKERGDGLPRRRSRAGIDARKWYQQGRWASILDVTLGRIYVLRCQLVHGGATCGGRLNRTALRRCTQMLGHLQPAIVLTMIDHGEAEDWGPLCYPPTGDA